MNSSYFLKFIVLIFISVTFNSQAQTATSCEGGLPGFISEPQEYNINAKENSVYDIIFYPGFTYRIKLCAKSTTIKLEFNLIDEKGNMQFTKIMEAGFFRDFEFDTLFHGKIIIKPLDTSSQEAQLLIGYKKKKK